MKANLEYLKDNYLSNFIGIKLSIETVQPYLDQMKTVLDDKYEIFKSNHDKKSFGQHYINVITSSEYNSLLKTKGIDKLVNHVNDLMEKSLDVTLLGLGSAQSGKSKEYFIVIKSEDLDLIRKIFNLPKKDFTVTLGFYPTEVYDARKNILVQLKDPFLKLLAKNYYNSGNNFDFLKEFEFFDYDPEKEIQAIKIEDSMATFRVDQNYFTVSIIGDNLRISAKWTDTLNKPYLSDTIISRKLKNI